MAPDTGPEQLPENKGTEQAADSRTPCPACRGRGRKFTTLRRVVDAAGGAAETDLLKRTQSECLHCTGSGRESA